MSAPKQGGGDISGQINWIVDRIKGFKIADPLKTTEIALANPEGYPIAKGAGLAITGYIISMLGDAANVDAVTRMGKIAQTGGLSTAINALVASYIYEAVNNPSGAPSGMSKGGVVRYTRSGGTIDVDNPQGLAPMYPGHSMDGSFISNL
jgi:hypothetical protein